MQSESAEFGWSKTTPHRRWDHGWGSPFWRARLPWTRRGPTSWPSRHLGSKWRPRFITMMVTAARRITIWAFEAAAIMTIKKKTTFGISTASAKQGIASHPASGPPTAGWTAATRGNWGSSFRGVLEWQSASCSTSLVTPGSSTTMTIMGPTPLRWRDTLGGIGRPPCQ